MCLFCDRRVGKLYYANGFLGCRTCGPLVYESQRAGRKRRLYMKAKRIRRRLGDYDGRPGIDPFAPSRQFRMHRKTYARLKAQGEVLERQCAEGAATCPASTETGHTSEDDLLLISNKGRDVRQILGAVNPVRKSRARGAQRRTVRATRGGSGSGWQGAKKATVEDSLSLSMAALMRKKALVPGSWTRGSWQWSYEGSEPHASIGYEANLVDPDTAWLRLVYTANGTPMDYRVRLVTTRPTYGGRRWWFLCPLARKDGGPPRRAAKLYLPPGRRYFASREALRAHLPVMSGEREVQRIVPSTCGRIWGRTRRSFGALSNGSS